MGSTIIKIKTVKVAVFFFTFKKKFDTINLYFMCYGKIIYAGDGKNEKSYKRNKKRNREGTK